MPVRNNNNNSSSNTEDELKKLIEQITDEDPKMRQTRMLQPEDEIIKKKDI